jgi:hypothetical protein
MGRKNIEIPGFLNRKIIGPGIGIVTLGGSNERIY